ncbi:unnamed protein product [Closterium sp. NIES-53]
MPDCLAAIGVTPLSLRLLAQRHLLTAAQHTAVCARVCAPHGRTGIAPPSLSFLSPRLLSSHIMPARMVYPDRPSLSHTLVPITPILSPSASRARLSRALAPAAPDVASPLLSRPVPSPLLSRPVAPAVALPLLSCPIPSPLLSRRVAPCCPVPSRRPCCPVASPPYCPTTSRRPSRPVPSASRFPSRPVARAPCALPVRRAPAAPCPSVAPRAPCPSAPVAAHPVRACRRPSLSPPASKLRDAAVCIALSSLLPESEETQFTQVRMASEFLTAIKARYATPTTVSLGRLFLPFLFPDLASFERTADLITHLRLLDSSYRAACTDAQLALLHPPMAITIYFIASSLPNRLASVRDALLLKHPSELTIEVLESALKDVESNLRSIASASGVVPPPLFHGCTVPQLPTFTASLATVATNVTAAAVMTSSRSRGRSGRRGGQGAGGGGGGGGGDVASGGGGSAGAGGAPRAAPGDSPAAAGGGDARVRQPPTGLPAAGGGAAAWYPTQRQQQQQPLPSQQPQQQQRQQQVSGQGSGQRQLQRSVVHPPCTYHVLTGARRSQPCGRSHHWVSALLSLLTWFDWPTALKALPLTGFPLFKRTALLCGACRLLSCLGASLAEVPVASVGTCVDTSPGATAEDASLSFTLDSGASHFFFRGRTTLTPLPTLVSVALADPTSGPVTACYTTTLPCPAVPSGSLTGFHVPSFSRNLVGVRPLVSQHVGVRIEPSDETAVCVDEDTYAHLATFTAEPGSGLHTLHTGPRGQQQLLPPSPVTVPCQVPASHQVSASPHVAVSGQVPVSGLPRVLPSLPPSIAPPCGPCVKGRLRATPHSSSLRLATEPFETPWLDVWGPASRPGPEQESFFLVVVDDYSRYTTVFPLAKKSDVTSTLIRWLLTTADTRGRRISGLDSDRRGEFRSGILVGFCREQDIRQSWTLPESPQHNGVAERLIGLVMEIARTSMTHARAPHFLWP